MAKKEGLKTSSCFFLVILTLLITFCNSQATYLSKGSTSQISNTNLFLGTETTKTINSAFLGTQAATIQKSPEINQYQGTISISLTPENSAIINFLINFAPNQNNCNFKKCFIGWITKYTSSDGQTIQGYPGSTDPNYPIFSLNANSADDYSISYSNSLDSTWSSLIDYACEKFNPFDYDPTTSTKFSYSSASASNLRTSQSTSSAGTYSTTLQLPNINLKQSLLQQTVQLDPSTNLLQNRAQNFKFQLASQKSTIQTGQIPSLQGKISTSLAFNRKFTDASLITNILREYSSISTKIKTLTKSLLQSKRLEPEKNIYFTAKQQFISLDLQPKTPSFDQNTILPGQTKQNIDITLQYQTGSDNILNSASTAKVSPINIWIFPIIKPLFQYSKELFNKIIFGQTVSLKIDSFCKLYIEITGAFIQCKANLIYSIFGQTKNLSAFNFVKNLNSFWSLNSPFSGNWDFYISIPFPPPFQYVTFNLYAKINYNYQLSLSINLLSLTPFKVKFQGFIQTGIDTDTRATIKVASLVQAGVFLRGTLVKVGTDPTLTLTFLFSQKKIIAQIQWYFWIIAFYYQWGFQWRRKKLFGGWTDWSIISKWSIQGIYQKYTILNDTYNIQL